MNIDVQIHSWNLAGADFVPVNQIFRARVSQLRKLSATFRKEQMKCNRETISPLWNPGKAFGVAVTIASYTSRRLPQVGVFPATAKERLEPRI
jgi:hypothetical protein